MSNTETDKTDFSFTDDKGQKIALLKSMQKNGLLLKFPLFNKGKHITILGASNKISFHITDETQTEKTLKYSDRIAVDFSNIEQQQFDNDLLTILLKHLQIYPIDKLPWRKYLTLGSLVNSEYRRNLLNKKSRLSVNLWGQTPNLTM